MSPQGWVTPVGHAGQRLVLAVGKESCDFAFHNESSSSDGGLDSLDFHLIEDCPGFTSVSFPRADGSSVAFASGYDGKVAKLQFH